MYLHANKIVLLLQEFSLYIKKGVNIHFIIITIFFI
jgi:hypothetical protein